VLQLLEDTNILGDDWLLTTAAILACFLYGDLKDPKSEYIPYYNTLVRPFYVFK